MVSIGLPTSLAGRGITVGSGAGLGAARRTTGAGTGAGSAAVTCALPKLGGKPQSALRLAEMRGTQLVRPPIPARKNTQPRLSTYCDPLNPDGGFSAGPAKD
jgi:hypothetical protein